MPIQVLVVHALHAPFNACWQNWPYWPGAVLATAGLSVSRVCVIFYDQNGKHSKAEFDLNAQSETPLLPYARHRDS